MAENGSQDIIKVMRNPTSEYPDRIHFLRLEDMFLQLLFLSYVPVKGMNEQVVSDRNCLRTDFKKNGRTIFLVVHGFKNERIPSKNPLHALRRLFLISLNLQKPDMGSHHG